MKDRLKSIVMLIAFSSYFVFMKWNTVTEVIDGNIIKLWNGQTVRLAGIESPSISWCGGDEAHQELERMLLGKTVKLKEVKADDYRRVSALVYKGKELVNEKMIESGWVRWDGTENELGARMFQLSEEAREMEKGVFGICRRPVKAGCLIKGDMEKRNGTMVEASKKYYFPGCSEYEAVVVERELGEEWFCTEEEAVGAGYEKGESCFGKEWRN